MGLLAKSCKLAIAGISASLSNTGWRLARNLPGAGRIAAAFNHRGALLREQSHPRDALLCHNRALQLRPAWTDALIMRGLALQDLGRPIEAIACYDQALQIDPAIAQAHYYRGNALLGLARTQEALADYEQALQIKPDYADAHFNRGVALQHFERSAEAVASYDHAIKFKPQDAEAYFHRGHALADLAQRDAAIASFEQAIAIRPAYAQARWSLVMARIPTMAAAHEDFASSRAEFSRGLDDLHAYFNAHEFDGAAVVGLATPFYLAYQEKSNRALLARYGSLCTHLMLRWQQKQQFAPVEHGPPANEVLRVGFVSAFVHSHSVWDAIVKGWIRHLDRGRFELHVFHLGSLQDEDTARAAAACTSFSAGARGLREWVATIADKRIDILIYPEIGMDPLTVKLASLRIAPVQAAAWGHPETTGLPTIDYYLSAVSFEPAACTAHYTEKPVTLPNLGVCYSRIEVASVVPDLAAAGVSANEVLLVCPGGPFKYAPANDFVFVEIARRLGQCRFIFFTAKNRVMSEILRGRLAAAFGDAGLDCADYVTFVPWLPKPEFHGLMQRADVFLDTIGFSGFNTAIQAVECNLPIVTIDGEFMRGRLAGGILRRMGLTDLIAADHEGYIELAVRLARDTEYRQNIRQRMHKMRDILYDDVAAVRALEDFLLHAYAQSRPPPTPTDST